MLGETERGILIAQLRHWVEEISKDNECDELKRVYEIQARGVLQGAWRGSRAPC